MALRAVVRFTPLAVVVLLSFSRDAHLRLDFALVIGISSVVQRPSPPPPKPHLSNKPAGQDPEAGPVPRTGHSTAQSEQKSQSYLDNLIAG
jgi:hypothetical protein